MNFNPVKEYKLNLSPNQFLCQNKKQINLYIKRDDMIHPFVSGNKYRKLKYNIEEIKKHSFSRIVTFGGAYSNHIAAVAFAGKENAIPTTGIIRGHELADKIEENPTLSFAKNCGMQLEFISRTSYRTKEEVSFLKNLQQRFSNFYLLPEGGTNHLAIKGCEEILTLEDTKFDYICCAVGTGGTLAGLINSAEKHQKVLGFPALKGNFLKGTIENFVLKNNWKLITEYHFGGYGKITAELVRFINDFNLKYKVLLDPIYTAKMAFGIMDLIEKDYFPAKSNILLIHTGGLQGINGVNSILKKKQFPLINGNQ